MTIDDTRRLVLQDDVDALEIIKNTSNEQTVWMLAITPSWCHATLRRGDERHEGFGTTIGLAVADAFFVSTCLPGSRIDFLNPDFFKRETIKRACGLRWDYAPDGKKDWWCDRNAGHDGRHRAKGTEWA